MKNIVQQFGFSNDSGAALRVAINPPHHRHKRYLQRHLREGFITGHVTPQHSFEESQRHEKTAHYTRILHTCTGLVNFLNKHQPVVPFPDIVDLAGVTGNAGMFKRFEQALLLRIPIPFVAEQLKCSPSVFAFPPTIKAANR